MVWCAMMFDTVITELKSLEETEGVRILYA